MHTFICTCEYPSGHTMKWQGSWAEIGSGHGCRELLISGRGTMLTVILGKYSSGKCLCIPELGAGSPLSHLSDVFWNFEQLARLICRTDAATIAYALADYSKHQTEL